MDHYTQTFSKVKGSIKTFNEKLDRNKNLFESFERHFSFQSKSTQQTLEINVNFNDVWIVNLYVISLKPIENKIQTKIQSNLAKIFSKNTIVNPIKFMNEYQEIQFAEEEGTLLYIIVDETFMDQVLENENKRAESIFILADQNNVNAKKLKNTYPNKIVQIHKNPEILVSAKNFPILAAKK